MLAISIIVMNRPRNGISSTVSIAAIVVLIIVAAAGWAAYAAFPSSNKTTTVTQSNSSGQQATVTQTVTQTLSGSSGVNTTQTGEASASYLLPISSTASFTISSVATSPQTGIWNLCQSSGICKQYVPNAKFSSVAGAEAATELASGAAQMEYGDTSGVIPSISKGAPIQLVANIMPVGLEWSITVAGNSSYKTLSDLHGKIFGIPTVGSAPEFLTEYILQHQLGWKLNTDYQVSPLGSQQAIQAALLAGSVQAQIQATVSIVPQLLSGEFRSVLNFTGPYPSQSLFASTSFIKQHPDAVRAMLEAFLQSAVMWQTNETAALNIMQLDYHLSAQAARIVYGTWYYTSDGAISLTGTQQAVNFLLNANAISNNVSASSFVSKEFAPIVY